MSNEQYLNQPVSGFKEQISRRDPSTLRSVIVEFSDAHALQSINTRSPRKVCKMSSMPKR